MCDDMTDDEGCPTCGSKNFGSIEMKRNKDDNNVTWKKQCYNCKKFWYYQQ